MSIKRHIPNAITCGNLVSGCLSILFAFKGNLSAASIMIFVAGIFDFFDGFSARLLNAKSPIGADLDSLSDVVSFGVAPGMIMYCLMDSCINSISFVCGGISVFSCAAFLLPVFAALRLAKFNIDTRQTTSFIGMPTPAMAILVASLPLSMCQTGFTIDGVTAYIVLLVITIVASYLMVSEIGFFSFKMKSVAWKGNEVRWVFIAAAVISFAVFQMAALPFIMLFYIILSLSTGISRKGQE